MKILRVGDIDGILLFGEHYGKLISELYNNVFTKTYLKYIVKYGEENESNFIARFINVMDTPINIHDAVENWRNYNWSYFKENQNESGNCTATGREGYERRRGWL